MATTIPACMLLLASSSGTGRNGIAGWDAVPPVTTTAAQRTAIVTAILAGTVVTQADVLALIATAAVAPVTQQMVYSVMTQNPATAG